MAALLHMNNNNNNNFGLIPSAGARLGYGDLRAAGVELPPPPEDYNPTVHRASPTPHLTQVLPFDNQDPPPPAIFLVRQEGATQAYALMDKEDIVVGRNRHPDWGRVLFAVVYPAIGHNVFQAPPPQDAFQCVAIKRLNRGIVDAYLLNEGEEDPYKEMARMEELGDDLHVLRHVEFLEDDDYLYIVTPKACREGTMMDAIPWFNSRGGTVPFDIATIMDPGTSLAIFRQILQILDYLERHRINHHDLSPDNFLFLTPGNLVVFDLAMSVRIPVNPKTDRRSLIVPQGNFGTRLWMDPFVYLNQQAYDGVAMDLWAAGIMFYNLLTNQILYKTPHPIDLYYRFFVREQFLSSQPLNQRANAMIQEIGYVAQFDGGYRRVLQDIINCTTAHTNMSREAIELLENLLREHPAERYTLAEAIESAYVQQED